MATATSLSADTRPAFVEFSLLESWLASSSALLLPLHLIESQQQAKGREVQRLLLQAHLQHRGSGDVGSALQLGQPTARCSTLTVVLVPDPLPPSLEPWNSSVWATPGPAGQAFFPSTRRWPCPPDRSPTNSTPSGQGRRTEPVSGIGANHCRVDRRFVSKRSLEEILPDAARDFDAFYQQRSVATAAGSILVAAVDGKGIPMVKPCGAQPRVRLTKGQKANKKRMATVATVFTRAPWVRTPQQVIESLFPTSRPDRVTLRPPPRPENKRVWASLLKGKTAVIEEVAEEMDRRDPSRSATRLALTDGRSALQIRVDQKLAKNI